MTEYRVLGAAFVILAICLAWLAVLLKREIVSAWSDALNSVAADIR